MKKLTEMYLDGLMSRTKMVAMLMLGLVLFAMSAFRATPVQAAVTMAPLINMLAGPAHAGSTDKWNVGDGSVKVTTDNRLSMAKPMLLPRTTTSGFYASSTVVASAGLFQVVTSSGGGPILVTATPSVSTRTVAITGDLFPDGMVLVIASSGTTTNTIIFQDEASLTGSKLELGAATRTLSGSAMLGLIWDATLGKWRELFYTADN